MKVVILAGGLGTRLSDEIDLAKSSLNDCQYCYFFEDKKTSNQIDRIKLMRKLTVKQ